MLSAKKMQYITIFEDFSVFRKLLPWETIRLTLAILKHVTYQKKGFVGSN